jgi:hypothetical protein
VNPPSNPQLVMSTVVVTQELETMIPSPPTMMALA